jgi:hypothetical protein
LATKKALNSEGNGQHPKTRKKDLVEFVDEAILYGHNCRSKRGRKRKPKSTTHKHSEQNKAGHMTRPEFHKIKLISNELIINSPKYLPDNKMHNSEEIELAKEDSIIGEDVKEEGKHETTRYLSLYDHESLKRLLVRNDCILNEYEEVTKDQSMEDNLEELLDLEKEIKQRLKATQDFLKGMLSRLPVPAIPIVA